MTPSTTFFVHSTRIWVNCKRLESTSTQAARGNPGRFAFGRGGCQFPAQDPIWTALKSVCALEGYVWGKGPMAPSGLVATKSATPLSRILPRLGRCPCCNPIRRLSVYQGQERGRSINHGKSQRKIE